MTVFPATISPLPTQAFADLILLNIRVEQAKKGGRK